MKLVFPYTSAARDGDLASLPAAADGTTIDTNFARVTLRHQEGGAIRLEVASNANFVQPQSNAVASAVSDQFALSEEWVAMLARATIRISGPTTAPCCSVEMPDEWVDGKDEAYRIGLTTMLQNIVLGVLTQLLGATVAPA